MDFRKMPPRYYPLIGLALIAALAVIITLPGWIAAGIGGMHIFLRAVCFFWIAVAILAVICVILIATDPHAQ